MSHLQCANLQPSAASSSANASSPAIDAGRAGGAPGWMREALSLLLLAAMVAYFLKTSWRKWPDPIVDSGPQLYAIWQTSQGALPYHDFLWNYGPFSVCLNAALFKVFGPGLMVLVAANLVFYAVIFALAYWAFRKAWGWLGAFAAMAVFVSVFSFSHLLGVGNYNFITPYAGEVAHGFALMLATVFVAVKWSRQRSWKLAFLLGLCGGLSAVIKPEFMLAGGVLAMAALLLRLFGGLRPTVAEIGSIVLGVILPTLAFALWFARSEAISQAFIDASQAWWAIIATSQDSGGVTQQAHFMGFNHASTNLLKELIWTGGAIAIMGVIWFMGRIINRLQKNVGLIAETLEVLVLFGWLCFAWIKSPEWFATVNKGWFNVGWCLPGLVGIIFILWLIRTAAERKSGQLSESTVMALMLVLLAGAMLARMPLMPRVYHFGFFQAALAGMVVAAVMVSELPRWTGEGLPGRFFAAAGCFFVLVWCCGAIVAKSNFIRKDQTEVIGQGGDRFYSTSRMIDGTGALVNWAAVRMSGTPTNTEVLVLPEGVMVNYLSRRISPNNIVLRESEKKFVDQLRAKPPEFVVLISRDIKEFGITRYGAPKNPGEYLVPWVRENYHTVERVGGAPLDPDAPVGGEILRLKKDLPADSGKSGAKESARP